MLAVTERVNTSDGQRMTGWPLGPPWGLDRGGPLWWRNSVSMKEEERETEIVHEGSEGERKAPGTLRTRAALQAAGEAGALGLIVPGLSSSVWPPRGSCSLSEFPSGTDLRALGSKLK